MRTLKKRARKPFQSFRVKRLQAGLSAVHGSRLPQILANAAELLDCKKYLQ
jgi:hypothetical protein